MQLSVLGPVLVDGHAPPGAKERALLTRLLVDPGAPVPAETLIEAAWAAERHDGVTRSLHVRLAKLRALLAAGRDAPVLVRDPAGYRLAVERDCVDACRFAALAEQAGHGAPAEALACCEQALALWRGEPFTELALPDDAATVEARRLHALRDRVRRDRARALAALGRPDEAAAELAALVVENPLREELVAELMNTRHVAGRHAEALEAYRELAARLAEVGLRPGPGVRELEARILRHDAAPAAPARLSNVGARVASIVGRDDDLDAVADALRAHRIVTLVGPAGVGKTTLAAEAARAQLGAMPDGAWLVELAPLRSAAEVLPAVGTALGIRRVGTGADDGGDRDALGILRERLRDARLLVVLDNAEQLVPHLGPVAHDLAAAGDGVRVLVTSRRPLGLAGEAVVPVRPLDPGPAEELFLQRAAAARPDWVADAAERDAVAEICRRIDGLPLAVELAAARLRALSATAIVERLDRGLGVLGRGGALEASIEASHALLLPDEQELFRRLSVFAGPFRLEDAEQVGGGDGLDRDCVLDLLVALTEHSMVQAEGSPRRYRMLEALREHGRARLDVAAAEAAARRHATHFAHISVTAAREVDRHGAEAVGDPLVPFHWDIDAALRWAIGRGETDLALELATGAGAFHHLVGTVTPGRERIERALALSGGEPARRIQAMRWQIALLLCELRLPDAAAAIAAARPLVERHGGRRERDELRGFAAQLALFEGDLDAAMRAIEGVYERARAHGEHLTAAFAAWTSGTVERMRGNPEAAIGPFTAACELVVPLVDICVLDNLTAALADAAAAAGREDEARAACERTLATALERPLGERNTYLLHEAALAAARAGDLERASTLAGAALTGARRDPVRIGPWHAPAARGDVALAAGDAEVARAEYEQSLALALDVRADVGPSLPVDARIALSHLRLAGVAGDAAAAQEHLALALRFARASRAPAIIAAAEAAAATAHAAP